MKAKSEPGETIGEASIKLLVSDVKKMIQRKWLNPEDLSINKKEVERYIDRMPVAHPSLSLCDSLEDTVNLFKDDKCLDVLLELTGIDISPSAFRERVLR